MKVIRRIIADNVFIEKKVKVCISKDKASFFFPSIYICAGLPNIKNPVIAADITKSKSRVIGTRIIFDLPIFTREP